VIGQIDPSQAKEWLTESNYTVAGVLLVIFVCFGLAVWRVISWIGREFVIPGRDRMFRHLDRVDDTMKDVSTSLQKLATVPERLDGIEEKVESISLRVKQIDANMGHDGGPRK
jgi:hypothetical protein